MSLLLVGVDVGATNIRAGLGDSEGLISISETVKTEEYGSVERLKELIRDTVEENDRSLEEVDAVGIGLPGLVNIDEKRLEYSFALGDLDLSRIEELGVDVYVENDANAAVLGEKVFGAGFHTGNLVTAIIGSGVGAGVYYGGSLLGSGIGGRSPEPSGIIVEEGFTWEEVIGGEHLPSYIEDHLDAEEDETLLEEGLTAEEIFRLSDKDEIAEKYVGRLADLNARGIATLVNLYAPEMITFSGAVAANNPGFMAKSFSRVEDYAINPVPDMKISGLGEKLGLYGAVALAYTRLSEQ